jgi:hypothetical protein
MAVLAAFSIVTACSAGSGHSGSGLVPFAGSPNASSAHAKGRFLRSELNSLHVLSKTTVPAGLGSRGSKRALDASSDEYATLGSFLQQVSGYEEVANGEVFDFTDGTAVLATYNADGSMRLQRPDGTWTDFTVGYSGENGDVGFDITVVGSSESAASPTPSARPTRELTPPPNGGFLTRRNLSSAPWACAAGRDVWVGIGAGIGAWAGAAAGRLVDGRIGAAVGGAAGAALGTLIDPFGGEIFGGALGAAVGFVIGSQIGTQLGGIVGGAAGSGIGGAAYDKACDGDD